MQNEDSPTSEDSKDESSDKEDENSDDDYLDSDDEDEDVESEDLMDDTQSIHEAIYGTKSNQKQQIINDKSSQEMKADEIQEDAASDTLKKNNVKWTP